MTPGRISAIGGQKYDSSVTNTGYAKKFFSLVPQGFQGIVVFMEGIYKG
jgi:hypothetical protein